VNAKMSILLFNITMFIMCKTKEVGKQEVVSEIFYCDKLAMRNVNNFKE